MLHFRKRLREWRSVVWHERHAISLRGMLRALLSGFVPRRVWRQRMRHGCAKCPIHARKLIRVQGVLTWVGLHACRYQDRNVVLGCGCCTWAVALTANPYGNGCWVRSITDNEGWPAYKKP